MNHFKIDFSIATNTKPPLFESKRSTLASSQLIGVPPVDVFDVKRSLEVIQKQASVRDDASEVSSVSYQSSGKSRRKSGFSIFSKKKRRSVVKFSIIEEFQRSEFINKLMWWAIYVHIVHIYIWPQNRIQNNWTKKCNDAGIPLSRGVLAEFKKRATSANSGHSKPKLSFIHCELVDQQVKFLYTAPSLSPYHSHSIKNVFSHHLYHVSLDIFKYICYFKTTRSCTW